MKRVFMAVSLVLTMLSSTFPGSVNAAQDKVEADEVVSEQVVTFYEQGVIGKSVWVIRAWSFWSNATKSGWCSSRG